MTKFYMPTPEGQERTLHMRVILSESYSRGSTAMVQSERELPVVSFKLSVSSVFEYC